MFGKNEIVGQKYFKDAGDKLFITSMFMTLQGEGPLRGEPAFFIRFAKCNLACSFCDTYFDAGEWYTLEEIDQKIEETIKRYYKGYVPEWARKVSDFKNLDLPKQRQMALVITGGEPSLQKNLWLLLDYFKDEFKYTQIESNGIVIASVPDSTIYVVSPKCSEKNGEPYVYLKPNPKVLERADCLKFVMQAGTGPYSQIPEWAFYSHKPIYISPMNIYNQEPQRAIEAQKMNNHLSLEERSEVNEVISFWTPGLIDMKAVEANHEYTAKFCVEYGCIFNMQLHLFAGLA